MKLAPLFFCLFTLWVQPVAAQSWFQALDIPHQRFFQESDVTCPPDPSQNSTSGTPVVAPPSATLYLYERVRFTHKVCLRVKVRASSGNQALFTVYTDEFSNEGDTIKIRLMPPFGTEKFLAALPSNVTFFLPAITVFGRDSVDVLGNHSYAATIPAGTPLVFSSEQRPGNLIPPGPGQFVENILVQLQAAEEAADAQRNAAE